MAYMWLSTFDQYHQLIKKAQKCKLREGQAMAQDLRYNLSQNPPQYQKWGIITIDPAIKAEMRELDDLLSQLKPEDFDSNQPPNPPKPQHPPKPPS